MPGRGALAGPAPWLLLTLEPERQLYALEAPYDVDLRRRAIDHGLQVVTDRYRAGYLSYEADHRWRAAGHVQSLVAFDGRR